MSRGIVCGCYYHVAHEKKYLPQVKSKAHTEILKTTSSTTLEQIFSNTTEESIKDCVYTFPLYDGVSVVSFDCHIGDRTLHGIVQEKREAKATYDKAVARGETAGLLEQLPEASDAFSTSLGNIPAGGQVLVSINFVNELKHDAELNGIRWTLPTSIAPRYGSGPYVAPGKRVVEDKDGIEITVDVDVGPDSFIQSVQSPSHKIAVTLGTTTSSSNESPAMHKASATLALGSAQLDEDFVLIVCNKDNGNPTALLETHSSIPNQRALMLDLVPKFSLPPARPEIVFVADRSGSMQGQIPTLISALKVFLKSLPVGIKFNICSFGSTHSFLWPKSRSYDSESLDQAMKHVQSFGADYGGTETYRAIKASIQNRYTDVDCEILLLTDGDIWSQDNLFDYLNRSVGTSIRVFPLGIGSGVSSALIEGVARAGNGFAQMVSDGEKLDKKVIRMLKGALSPHISDYTMEVGYENPGNDEQEGDDMSWELVEKVTDSLRVMSTKEKALQTPQEHISLFDPSIDSDKNEAEEKHQSEEQDSFANLPEIQVPKLLQTPHKIPTLFPFARTNVYILMSPDTVQKEPKSVILRGSSAGQPLELEIPVQKLPTPGKKIHQLAARKAMQELEEGRGWLTAAKNDDGKLIKDSHPSQFDDLIKREAVRLGVQYQVGGKWCSFVAVQDNEEHFESEAREEQPVEDNAFSASYTPYSARMQSASTTRRGGGPGRGGGSSTRGGASFQSYSAPMRRGVIPRSSGPEERYDAVGSKSLDYDPTIGADWADEGEKGECEESDDDIGFGLIDDPPCPAPPSGPQASMAQEEDLIDYSDEDMGFGTIDVSSSPLAKTAPASNERLSKSVSTQPPKPKTDSEKVYAIIDKQTFEGSWNYSQELFDILGLQKSGSTIPVRVTLLVVAYLEKKMGAEQDVWELVVEKAKAWLQTAGIEADKLAEWEANASETVMKECK